jgi:hypothetical protein
VTPEPVAAPGSEATSTLAQPNRAPAVPSEEKRKARFDFETLNKRAIENAHRGDEPVAPAAEPAPETDSSESPAAEPAPAPVSTEAATPPVQAPAAPDTVPDSVPDSVIVPPAAAPAPTAAAPTPAAPAPLSSIPAGGEAPAQAPAPAAAQGVKPETRTTPGIEPLVERSHKPKPAKKRRRKSLFSRLFGHEDEAAGDEF